MYEDMNERLNKTSICSVVFLDIIDYSKKSVSEQIDDKNYFNSIINEAIKDTAQNDRIILDTGDGASIALLGEPEEALFVSLTIRDGLLKNKENGPQFDVRIGINLGPVRVVSDINGRPNIIGDGINVAQRVMSFAEPNQILVSRSYYEVTSRLTKEITGMFSYFGVKQDKHVRDHEVYVIRSPGSESSDTVEDTAAIIDFPEHVDAPELVDTAVAAKPSLMARYKFGLLTGLLSLALAAGFLLLHKPSQPEVAIKMAAPVAATPVPEAAKASAPVPTVPAEISAVPSPVAPQISANSASPENLPAEPPKAKPVKRSRPLSNQANSKDSQVRKKSSADVEAAANAKKAEPSHENVNHEAVASQPEAGDKTHEEPAAKTGWDTFKRSIQKGSETKTCTPAEAALNQCK
jgi:hypothetical protein